jgi:hypothetical protein
VSHCVEGRTIDWGEGDGVLAALSRLIEDTLFQKEYNNQSTSVDLCGL